MPLQPESESYFKQMVGPSASLSEKIAAIVDLYFRPWGAAKGEEWEWLTGDQPFEPEVALRLIQRTIAETPQSIPSALEDVWNQARKNHEDYSATGDIENDIRFFALGLAGEAGELANFVKKRWRDGDGHDQAIRYEVADVCAYAFMLADRMGMSPGGLIATIAEKQQAFIAKMKARGEHLSTRQAPIEGSAK